jgi:hypothetical protein
MDALPILRTFVEHWGITLGKSCQLPAPNESMSFDGSWAHIELLLTNMFSNAKKHRVDDDSPISSECKKENHEASFDAAYLIFLRKGKSDRMRRPSHN